MFSCMVLGHYPITNSNGMSLNLNYDFNCCKTVVFKIVRSLKGQYILTRLLNQARAWFLKIVSVRTSVCVFVYVCLPPKLLITSGVMWRDVDLI